MAWSYPSPGQSFIPEATGQVVTVNPDDPEHRAIFGEEFCDLVRAAQEKFRRNGPKYYQMVVKDKHEERDQGDKDRL